MKFEYIKPNMRNTHAYNIVAGLKTGDIIELTGNMAAKAAKNPHFKQANGNKKVTITPEESQIIWDEMKATPPELKEIATLQSQLDRLEAKLAAREEHDLDIDEAFAGNDIDED